jgi:beta-galactosidase
MKRIIAIIIGILLAEIIYAQNVIDMEVRQRSIASNDWKLWLDEKAPYQDDALFLPPAELSEIPVNEPTGGWENLTKGLTVHLPATVEEYFWGKNDNSYGVSGDYLGVSWFSTSIEIPSALKNKKIQLYIERARVRTEIYINQQLAGYNLVDGTSFYTDITPFLKLGAENSVAIRITDPNGSFTWCDWPLYNWGNYKMIPSHGFSGITGDVQLLITDNIYVDDIFVMNKPQPHNVDVEIIMHNASHASTKGEMVCSVYDAKDNSLVALNRKKVELSVGDNRITEEFRVQNADLWSLESPNLYYMQVKWEGENNTLDEKKIRFGFRWFEVREVGGDKQFYLNGKRIVLRSAISWGFWPINGIYPGDELAEKQIDMAKSLGLNMLNFHRAIGHEKILDLADEKGLLYYAEPGGYNDGPYDAFSQKWKHTKITRMVKQFRNHPSLVIYNMLNEASIDPTEEAYRDMRACHILDETRIITYTSQYYGPDFYNGKCPLTACPSKLHMLPYSQDQLEFGWYDEHHAAGPGVYFDSIYNNPTDYRLYSDHSSEIIFFGEEGAIGTPARLQLIRDKMMPNKPKGWDGDDYIRQYEAYDKFLDEKGFRKAFPAVDSLTRSLGNVAYYYQGRMIENIRINNSIDGYVVNGWEGEKLENHSGIVDCYRNPKGDIPLIAYYNQPLYVAVKIRNKVIETGKGSLVDFYIVNEKNLKGNFRLEVTVTDSAGIISSESFPVRVSGGPVYGELLKEGVSVRTSTAGYCTVKAQLKKGNSVAATGVDQLFSVKLSTDDLNRNAMVYDSSGIINQFYKTLNLPELEVYKGGKPESEILICGKGTPINSYNVRQELLEWVAEGHSLIIVADADKWAEYLNAKEVIDYRGRLDLKTVWYGGNYFVKDHPLFTGLPTNTAFNWEYQCFARYDKERYGLRIVNDEAIVGAYSDHRQELFSAVSIIPLGKGKIVLSTLDMLSNLQSGNPASGSAKKLFLNFVSLDAP